MSTNEYFENSDIENKKAKPDKGYANLAEVIEQIDKED